MTEAMFQLVVQGGSFAVLAFVVLWSVTKALPARDKAFVEAINQQRLAHEAAQALQRADHKEIQLQDCKTFETSINRICASHENRTQVITQKLDLLLQVSRRNVDA